jgi:hypothetical protein
VKRELQLNFVRSAVKREVAESFYELVIGEQSAQLRKKKKKNKVLLTVYAPHCFYSFLKKSLPSQKKIFIVK